MVGELHQLDEALDGALEGVVAVVRPGELVQGAVVVGAVLKAEDLGVGPDRGVQLVEVEVVFPDAHPRLWGELAVRSPSDQRLEGVSAPLVVSHLHQGVAQQVVGPIDEAVAGEVRDEGLEELDCLAVVLQGLLGGLPGLARREVGDALVVAVECSKVLVVGPAKVQLGQPEEAVGRVQRVGRIAPEEFLEAPDGVQAPLALLGLEFLDAPGECLFDVSSPLLVAELDDPRDVLAIFPGEGFKAAYLGRHLSNQLGDLLGRRRGVGDAAARGQGRRRPQCQQGRGQGAARHWVPPRNGS